MHNTFYLLFVKHCLFQQKIKRPYKKKPKLEFDPSPGPSSSCLSPTHSGKRNAIKRFHKKYKGWQWSICIKVHYSWNTAVWIWHLIWSELGQGTFPSLELVCHLGIIKKCSITVIRLKKRWKQRKSPIIIQTKLVQIIWLSIACMIYEIFYYL